MMFAHLPSLHVVHEVTDTIPFACAGLASTAALTPCSRLALHSPPSYWLTTELASRYNVHTQNQPHASLSNPRESKAGLVFSEGSQKLLRRSDCVTSVYMDVLRDKV